LGICYIFMSQRVKESVTGEGCRPCPGIAGQVIGIGLFMSIVVIGFGSNGC
jgi:hypothetical protein